MFKLYDVWFSLFLRKVIEIDVTRCLDFSSKCTKNAFGGRAPPGPTGGAYSLQHCEITTKRKIRHAKIFKKHAHNLIRNSHYCTFSAAVEANVFSMYSRSSVLMRGC